MSITVFYDPTHEGHAQRGAHPERPARLAACLDAIQGEADLVRLVTPPAAEREQLTRVHGERYLDSLRTDEPRMLDLDTYITPSSFDVATRAAGAACAAVDSGGRAFALVRPPGHHASGARAMGFCLINSVAVGAAHAIASGRAERVAIVDIDVHHGNGTQEIFWERSDVVFISMHQYPWYPWGSGALDECGEGEGEGATVNIPLPAMSGDDVYIAAVGRVVLPILGAVKPDLIMVSAGFDAHSADPLSLQEVSAGGFGVIMGMLAKAADELCGGRLVACLEGGYELGALSQSLLASIAGMDRPGAPRDATGLTEGLPFGAHGLGKVVDFHSRRWNL